MSKLKPRTCWPLVAFLLAAAVAPASPQDAGSVRATLSLSSEKKVFRAGEPIRLVISFTSERDGYQLNDTTTKPPSAVDAVTLSPDSGVHAWAAEYTGGGGYHPDYASIRTLSRAPTKVELTLNDWYRFDRAGRYAVKVTTSRVLAPGARAWEGAALRLTTNEVNFEVVEMSAEAEEAEVRRLSALLDAVKGWQEEARLAEELSYLSGEPSTREKARRYLAGTRAGGPGNFAHNIHLGFFMARDRELVVRLLEAAIRDPEVIPSHGLLQTASSLRLMSEGARRPAMTHVLSPQASDPRAAEVLRGYVAELAAGLPKRKGESRTAAAMTALTNLPRDERGNASPVPQAVRDVLVGEFDSFHPFDREYLLRVYWDVLRDPSLLPSLVRMLAADGQANFQVRGQALRRLLELAPERARPYVLAELRDPSSVVDYEVLAALGDKTLPEADDALLGQIRALAPQRRNFDMTLLQHKTKLAARYASAGVYDALLEVYRTWGDRWQPDARGALLGYFARYNEAQAVPLAEQALAQIQPGQDLSFLLELTRPGYHEAVRELLRRRLEGGDPQALGTAAYVMSQHGAEADGQLVESRLRRWRKEWAGRATELDAAGASAQRMAEVNLVEALLRAKVWKLSEEKAAGIARGCVSEDCRRRYAPEINKGMRPHLKMSGSAATTRAGRSRGGRRPISGTGHRRNPPSSLRKGQTVKSRAWNAGPL